VTMRKTTVSPLLILSVFTILCSMGCNKDDDDGDDACANTTSTFTINLTTSGCTITPGQTHSFSMTTDQNTDTRTITANSIPEHKIGQFPNSGNPNTVSQQPKTYNIDLTPSKASTTKSAQGSAFGILFSGVEVDPFTAEFFIGTNGANMEWNYNALTTTVQLGTDCNNAHVQPSGKYHYHGTPNAYLDDLNVDGSQMVKVGYAADGYPIYYKYGYDNSGTNIIELASGYQLKNTERGGNGSTAPDGCPDGSFFQDYEYISSGTLLDECNGRTGKTTDSVSEYYYVITDNFPSSPLCFSGTPSADFAF